MKKITLIYFVLVALIMVGCKDNSVLPEPVEYKPLIPLSVGNYWLYQGFYLKPEDGSVDFQETGIYGFIIHEPPNQAKKSIALTNYQISICTENLLPIDDTSYLLYGGSKLVYQGIDGFYYSGIVRKDTVVMKFDDLIFRSKVRKDDSLNAHVFFYSPLGNGSNVPDEVITKYVCISTDSLFTTH